MNTHIHERRDGFTLVETLVAIALIGLVLTVPMTLAHRSLQSARVTKEGLASYYLAQDAMEYLTARRDANIKDGRDWLHGLSSCMAPNGCRVDTTREGASAIAGCGSSCMPLRYDAVTGRYGYSGSWQVTELVRVVRVEEITPGSEAKVTVNVTWDQDGIPRQFVLTRHLYNIYDLALASGSSATSGAICGNGIVEPGEHCDGGTGGSTCSNLGYTGGSLSCTGSCTYNVSGCTSSALCGNGIVEPGEQCDGGLGGATCVSLGYAGGSLSCSSCSYNTSGCFSGPVCGNGSCDAGENSSNCPADCGAATYCGDGTCNGSETSTSCPADCAASTDTFTVSSGKTVAAHTGEGGRTYSVIESSLDCENLYINPASDRVDASYTEGQDSGCDDSYEGVHYSIDQAPATANYTVRATYGGISGTDSVNLYCRIQNADNFYMLRVTATDGRLYKNFGGTWTQLASNGTGSSSGTAALTCTGGTISATYGSITLSNTDGSHSAKGKAGFGMGDSTGQPFSVSIGSQWMDNLKVE